MEHESSSEEEPSLRRYKAASVHPEVRTYIARVVPALKAAGLSYKRQREILCEAGYDISEASFRRHRACIDEGWAPLSTTKSSGRPKALTAQQIMIFIGWVLDQNAKTKLWVCARACALLRTSLASTLDDQQCRSTSRRTDSRRARDVVERLATSSI
jgi:hypothetical protein